MKYTLTPTQAAKLVKKLTEEKALLLSNEENRCTFNALPIENVDTVRPDYSYGETQSKLERCDLKIRLIKHALNCFNCEHVVGDTGLTIDQILIYIPQLTEMKARLNEMQSRLRKRRVQTYYNKDVIDYEYTNYSPEQAKADYIQVSDTLRKLQVALDYENSTATIEVELPDRGTPVTQ